jgi:hypothetical protein
VYYAAHRFGVVSKGASTLQKDLMHDRGRVGRPAHVELGTVTGSATLLQFGGAGQLVLAAEDYDDSSFLEGKLVRPRAD